MNIGWLIRVGGIFGSVRESVEIGNALMRIGHKFTMYTDDGKDLGWLPNTLGWKHTNDLKTDKLDVLVWSDSPDDPYFDIFKKADAKVKSFCVMGFSPEACTDVFLGPRHHELVKNYWTLCDGPWQIEYISKYTDNCGEAMGGVNTAMFRPIDTPQVHSVIWSGDPRERKGGDMVRDAIWGLNANHYSKKRIAQKDLAEFICRAPIFADGHKRGGWANPVLEAMACGRAVVCTDTECNSDFAVHEFNCLKANTAKDMREAIERLTKDVELRKTLSINARGTALEWDYDRVAPDLAEAMERRLKLTQE